jgi:hypothetical protein
MASGGLKFGDRGAVALGKSLRCRESGTGLEMLASPCWATWGDVGAISR